jgi:hypothetical protein
VVVVLELARFEPNGYAEWYVTVFEFAGTQIAYSVPDELGA